MILSRGGGGEGGFSKKKNSRKFCRLFFSRSTKLIFPALPRHYRDPVLAKKFWQKFLGSFLWKFCPKSRVFSSRVLPSKLVYIGAEGALRTFLGPVTKNGYLKVVQRGTFWVGWGSNS